MSDQDELDLARKALQGDSSALVRLIRTVVRTEPVTADLRQDGFVALRRAAISLADQGRAAAAARAIREADLMEFGRCEDEAINVNGNTKDCALRKDHPGACTGNDS